MEIVEKKDLQNLLKGYNMLLYFSGSMIMIEPTEECVADFWKTGILKFLPVGSKNPRFTKAASQLRESCTDIATCRKMLLDDFARLFRGLNLALPLESEWSAGSVESDAKRHDPVTAFYRSYGWKSKYQGLIPDDHLGIELLFLTIMIDKYLSFDDEACRKEMSREIRRFIRRHLLTWIPEWNEQVQSNALSLCYKGISTLIYASIEDLDRIFYSADSSGL
jgi:TorA-specific chaperone